MVATTGLGIYGVGYNSGGKYKTLLSPGKRTPEYITWRSMLMRCYSVKHHTTHVNGSSCIDSYVCDEWKDFQVFAEWYHNNKIDGWELDKDILVKGNECYCPECCRYIPLELNCFYKKTWARKKDQAGLPVGVYKVNDTRFLIPSAMAAKYSVPAKYNTMCEAHLVYKTLKVKNIKEVLNKFRPLLCKEIISVVEEDIESLLKI